MRGREYGQTVVKSRNTLRLLTNQNLLCHSARVVPLLSDEPLPLVRPKHAIKCGPPLQRTPLTNRSRFITRRRLLRRGTYLNPQALNPQAFRFEAGQGSDLMSATWRLLPRIDVMMFCPEQLVKRAWIWISAKARVAVGNGGRSALSIAP